MNLMSVYSLKPFDKNATCFVCKGALPWKRIDSMYAPGEVTFIDMNGCIIVMNINEMGDEEYHYLCPTCKVKHMEKH